MLRYQIRVIIYLITIITTLSLLIPIPFAGSNTSRNISEEILQITNDNSDYFDISFTPDGKGILYVSDESSDGFHQIWKMDLDGNNRQQLTFERYDHSSPSINVNGNMLLYHRGSPATGQEICIKYISNNTVQKIANGSYPLFNHDFSKIIFLGLHRPENSSYDHRVIEIYDLDSGLSNIISIYPQSLFSIYAPKIDSKGECIVFPGNNVYSGIDASPGIHLYFLSNGSIIQVIPEAGFFPGNFKGAYELKFCFDDKYITYLNGSSGPSTGIICIVDIYGTNSTVLFNSEGIEKYDIYEPDLRLIYIKNQNIYLTNIPDIDFDGIPDIIDDDRDGGSNNPDDPEWWKEDEKNTYLLLIGLLVTCSILFVALIIIMRGKKKEN